MNMAEVIKFRPAFPTAAAIVGFSAESGRAASAMRAIAHDDAVTIYKSNRTTQIATEIDALRDDYSDDDWDGYGAKGLGGGTLMQAEQFLRSLPFSIPLPEVLPEPTGAVALEWRGQNAIFVVSVSDTGRLVYAGRFGKAKNNGVDYFADGVPPGILLAIRRASLK